MSRGFRNSDVTLELSSQAAAGALERLKEAGAAQAKRAGERRAQGKHGICEDCGRQIDPERLELLPDATRCVACQTRMGRSGRRL